MCLPAAFASSSELSARATVRPAVAPGSRATAMPTDACRPAWARIAPQEAGGERVEVGLDVGQDDCELVAAEPAGDVDGAAGRADRRCDPAQRGVAGHVAARVVQRLEVVEVDDDHGQV